jgi:hypothetical protein
LKWQAIATLAMAAVAGSDGRGLAAACPPCGGIVSITAVVVYAVVFTFASFYGGR